MTTEDQKYIIRREICENGLAMRYDSKSMLVRHQERGTGKLLVLHALGLISPECVYAGESWLKAERLHRIDPKPERKSKANTAYDEFEKALGTGQT